jgi:ABC-type sugar transport system substrate-binding protein
LADIVKVNGKKEKKMKKILIIIMIVALAGMMAMGWGCKTEEAAGEEAAAEGEKGLVGYADIGAMNILFIATSDYLGELSNEAGYEYTVVSCENDAAKQASDIQDLVTKGCDGIIVATVDSKAINSSVKYCRDAGIPLVLVNRPPAPDNEYKADAFSGQDAVVQAYDAGVALNDILTEDGIAPGDVKIMECVGDLRDENAINRKNGFAMAVEEFGWEVVSEVPTEWNPDKLGTGTASVLSGRDDINAVFLHSDFMWPALESVLESNGMLAPRGEANHIYMAAQDLFPAAVEPVRKQYIDVTVTWDLMAQAEAAVDALVKLMNGETLSETTILSQGRTITFENIDTETGLWGVDYIDAE